MKERHLKHMPIVDQDVRPLGVLNARDALEALLEEVGKRCSDRAFLDHV
jgi:CBS domain-containing protein